MEMQDSDFITIYFHSGYIGATRMISQDQACETQGMYYLYDSVKI